MGRLTKKGNCIAANSFFIGLIWPRIRKSPFEQGNGTLVSVRGADKSLARPGRKQTNVSVRMA